MRCILFTVLLVGLVLSTIPATHAYTTTTSVQTVSPGIMVFETANDATDSCTALDAGSHLAMATSASIQARILETANNGGVTGYVPMGGGTLQATCTSELCEWKWYRGFYFYIRPVFFRGVYYTGPASSAAASPTVKTQPVQNSYNNWGTNFPVSWSNLSYWGKRLVVMQTSNGKWRNVEVATRFTQLVCEHYVYTNSDGVAGITPTFPGGSPITLVSSSGHVYSYCGKKVSINSQGVWILPKCDDKFPWWAGLVIACGCYVILVAVIIIIWCCCCMARRNKEEHHRREVIATEKDNVSHIPSQTELGLSQYSSQRSQSYEDSTGGTYSYSESSSSGHGSSLKSSSASSSSLSNGSDGRSSSSSRSSSSDTRSSSRS